MTDLKIVVVPKELYYHEVNYVRGLETAARTMLAALEKFAAHYPHGVNPDLDEAYGDARAAIAQAEAAGIKMEG